MVSKHRVLVSSRSIVGTCALPDSPAVKWACCTTVAKFLASTAFRWWLSVPGLSAVSLILRVLAISSSYKSSSAAVQIDRRLMSLSLPRSLSILCVAASYCFTSPRSDPESSLSWVSGDRPPGPKARVLHRSLAARRVSSEALCALSASRRRVARILSRRVTRKYSNISSTVPGRSRIGVVSCSIRNCTSRA